MSVQGTYIDAYGKEQPLPKALPDTGNVPDESRAMWLLIQERPELRQACIYGGWLSLPDDVRQDAINLFVTYYMRQPNVRTPMPRTP